MVKQTKLSVTNALPSPPRLQIGASGVGNAEIEIDKATLNRLNEVSKMTPEDKNLVWSFLDAFILKTKLQGVMK